MMRDVMVKAEDNYMCCYECWRQWFEFGYWSLYALIKSSSAVGSF